MVNVVRSVRFPGATGLNDKLLINFARPKSRSKIIENEVKEGTLRADE